MNNRCGENEQVIWRPPLLVGALPHWVTIASGAVSPESVATTSPSAELRRAEHLVGRDAAIEALCLAGCVASGIEADGDGVPLWPEGYTGSIAHSAGCAVAIAASTRDAIGLGIDIEPTVGAEKDAIDALVADSGEREWIVGDAVRALQIFSAKEALFKALFPLHREYFGFEAVHLEALPQGGFEAKLTCPVAHFPQGTVLQVLSVVSDGWVTSAVVLPACGGEVCGTLANDSPTRVAKMAAPLSERPLEAVASDCALVPSALVELASNENPLGCSSSVAKAIADVASDTNLYPDLHCRALRHAIAAHTAVAPDQVLPGAGSSEIIMLAVRAYLGAGRSAMVPRYSFPFYEYAIGSVGSQPITIPAHEFAVDVSALCATVTNAIRIVFLATPNNPTGLVIDPAALESLADNLPQHVLLVIDEAYREFVDPDRRPDTARMLAGRKNLLLLRTFSKLHGLAGLRVGYGLGDPTLLQTLRRLQVPFSVSSIAQAAAIAALGDGDFAERSRTTNAFERERLTRAIEVRNLRTLPSSGNFLLIEVGDGLACARAMAAHGVIIRPAADYGLPRWIRVTIGLPAENRRFLEALDAWSAAKVAKHLQSSTQR